MIGPMTYVVQIDRLSADVARLVHVDPSGGPSLALLELPRDQWENLGRPARLYVQLTEDAPERLQ